MGKENGTALAPRKAEQAEALEQMNPALRKVASAIREKLENLRDAGVITFYEIGELVAKVCGNRGAYGDHAIDLLAGSMPTSANTLRYARLFVDNYSKSEVKKITRAAEKNGHEFCQSHWVVLVQYAGRGKIKLRKKGIALVVDQGYTVAEMSKEMQRLDGRNTRNAPQGRKPAAPKTPIAGMHQMSRYQRDMGSRVSVWDSSVFVPLGKLSGEEVTDELLAQVETTKADLLDTVKTAESTISKLDVTLVKLRKAKKSGGKPAVKKPATMERPAKKQPGTSTKKTATPKKKTRTAARATAKKVAAAAKKSKITKKKTGKPAPA